MKYYLFTFTFLLLFSNCSTPTPNAQQNRVEGLWKLHSMEVLNASKHRKAWKPGTQGYLLYDAKQHVSLHLTINQYDSFAIPFPNFTDSISSEALRHLTNNYNYMGLYEENDSIVRHIKLSHSNPNEWGDTAYRKFYLKNDTLIMTPIEKKNSSLLLKWVRYR